jgi:hypothetical protein
MVKYPQCRISCQRAITTGQSGSLRDNLPVARLTLCERIVTTNAEANCRQLPIRSAISVAEGRLAQDLGIESPMGRVERGRELARKRKRRVKLKKYRALYAKASTESDKAEILEKVRKISPFAVLEDAPSE